jgi:hypothetical protein
MILELTENEHLVLNSLIDAGLSDFAVLAQMFHIYGITTSILKKNEIVEAIEGGIAS